MKKSFVSGSKDKLNSGAYQLILKISKATRIKVGALGLQEFIPGYYIYTGSAMRNLESRIDRHIKRNKKKHWHIDYLTTHRKVKIIQIKVFESIKRQECEINLETSEKYNGEFRIKGFGSSDCNQCISHLIYLPDLLT